MCFESIGNNKRFDANLFAKKVRENISKTTALTILFHLWKWLRIRLDILLAVCRRSIAITYLFVLLPTMFDVYKTRMAQGTKIMTKLAATQQNKVFTELV